MNKFMSIYVHIIYIYTKKICLGSFFFYNLWDKVSIPPCFFSEDGCSQEWHFTKSTCKGPVA